MHEQFGDRILKCVDCDTDFIFTAGEQLFFFDKQFKNDPKRCKPCKSRRSGLAAAANGQTLPTAGITRTETRTECSDCGVETTVPFKPTQGRPVLCRACFGKKMPVRPPMPMPRAPQIAALTELSLDAAGAVLSHDAAVLAMASMASAHEGSSVATEADLALIAGLEAQPAAHTPAPLSVEDLIAEGPSELYGSELSTAELIALAANEPAQA